MRRFKVVYWEVWFAANFSKESELYLANVQENLINCLMHWFTCLLMVS